MIRCRTCGRNLTGGEVCTCLREPVVTTPKPMSAESPPAVRAVSVDAQFLARAKVLATSIVYRTNGAGGAVEQAIGAECLRFLHDLDAAHTLQPELLPATPGADEKWPPELLRMYDAALATITRLRTELVDMTRTADSLYATLTERDNQLTDMTRERDDAREMLEMERATALSYRNAALEVEQLRRDAELGRIAMRYVDRLSDPAECDPLSRSAGEFVAAIVAALSGRTAG